MRASLAALALAMVLPVPVLLGGAARAGVVVRPGETLSEIAERNGVSLTRLMQANGITNPDLVVVGQTLVIPGGAVSNGSSPDSVTVRPGETLSEIAERNGISLNRLMQLNGISNPDLVVTGQRLVLAPSRQVASGTGAPQPTAPYTVKSGESLSEIAERFGTSTERLIQLNRISNPNLVVSGTRLAIPARPAAGSARASGGGRPATQHVVQPGESLSTIAERYGMSTETLIAINAISDPNMVWAGSRLRLQAPPAPRPATKPAARLAAPAQKPKAKPASPAQPSLAVRPSSPQPQSGTEPAARVTPASTRVTAASPTAASPTATTPTAAAAPATAAATTASPTTAATTASAATAGTRIAATSARSSAKPPGADWRSYGPLQVDWANWQPMGGSYVAPTLNGDGQALYLAVNCGARKLNATSQSGQWKSWDAPQTDFEQKLITDLCRAKGS